MPDSISFKKSSVKPSSVNASSNTSNNNNNNHNNINNASQLGSSSPAPQRGPPTSNAGSGLGQGLGQGPPASASSRRKALKEFYKLQEQQQRELSKIGDKDKSIGEAGASDPTSTANGEEANKADGGDFEPKEEEELVLTLENFDEKISEIDFLKLVKYENEIKEVLNSNESEIKSIIYNNYYELIKINDVLLNLKDQSQALAESTEKHKENKTKESSSGAGVGVAAAVPVQEEEGEIVIGSDDEEDEDQETTTAKHTTLDDDEDGIISSLLMIKEKLQTLKKVNLNILPSDDTSNSDSSKLEDHLSTERLTKCINRLILSDSISADYAKLIEENIPSIQGESIRLQLNNIRNRKRV